MRDPRSILITGASSGIGAALAACYAAPGVTLHLSGRDRSRLGQVVDRCRLLGAAAQGARLDVTQAREVAEWVAACHRRRPLDLVIANAGVAGGTAGAGESEAQTRHIFAVNVDGVLNTVLPALDVLRARPGPRRGQIAIMSSLAGFRGFPGAPAYSASKMAVRAWGEALAVKLAPEGIEVSVICPGFVATPMTANNPFRMPFLMPAEDCARIVKRGLARGRRRIAFPRTLYALSLLIGALPPALIDPVMALLPEKPAIGAPPVAADQR